MDKLNKIYDGFLNKLIEIVDAGNKPSANSLSVVERFVARLDLGRKDDSKVNGLVEKVKPTKMNLPFTEDGERIPIELER